MGNVFWEDDTGPHARKERSRRGLKRLQLFMYKRTNTEAVATGKDEKAQESVQEISRT